MNNIEQGSESVLASAACKGGFSVVGKADVGPTAELEEVWSI